MKKNYYDCLIIGGGLAGLYVALNLNSKLNIALVTKDFLNIGNSELAQGGIAAELSKSDSKLIKHIEDTLTAGSNINNSLATKTLVYEASDNIERLIDFGVNFDKDREGNLLLAQEGGHKNRRILRAGGDATGREVMRALKRRISEKENIDLFENTMATDLIIKKNKCYGAFSINNAGKINEINASKTVLATGGIGSVYKHTTNPSIATGDGISMANRAKIKINDMEFIQFHPTGFFNNKEGKNFLISEAVRGEGGVLLNIDGEKFMSKYHKLKDLAPRDIVSQSIYKEMYDTWSDHVYLDIRCKSKEYLLKRFPTIYNECSKYNIFMEKDLIPVAPVEHFSNGGITINIDGETSMENLYANGECSCSGVHGANRLASNSLLECIVFGRKIAININSSKLQKDENVVVKQTHTHKHYNFRRVRQEIREIMEKYVGIVRTSEGLTIAKKIIDNHYNNLSKAIVHTINYYETLNMATTAKLIIDAAIARKTSIGCHYRLD